ncbi:NADH-quinone oxidoreductase subunit NuoN [Sphingomonas sp. AP4-R1]|uniref:NADH-quinone oxidoreductase subunit NuoN n=1 Tax=Sphingomonas sp. AP4-R1 TaxID=2735134 RepID=UPI0014937284|nr:NADH-quinone oxidoreductase subunit NuoN [Sphingomonas sp. AP4-R1]QJU58740.1 NADH-quinone oxidoreductase subunit NuoN [Sphingomonas sp. AP4-R1]
MTGSVTLAASVPELILSIGALLLLLVAGWRGDGGARAISWAAVALLAAATYSLCGTPSHAGSAYGGLYRADAFAGYAKLLIYITSAVAIMAAPGWFSRTGAMRSEYPILILFSATGMGIMASAGDLLTLYVGLELQSLAAYVLASFMRRDTRSAEAGLKYFVLGALASGILLYGISLLYGFAGTTQFTGLRTAFGGGVSTGLLFGLVFVLAGLSFKISAVPFHMWTPDVYEGAPTPVTAFFASAPKVAAMALLVRVVVEAMGPATDAWRQIIIFTSLASIVLGAVAAIGQTNIKRLLAYSSINNVGFALIGLAAGTPEGVSAVMIYMTVYVAMTLGSFLCILRMRDQNGAPVESIAALSGLSRSRPALAAALAMFMFSLAGIPPLFGFYPKLAVFGAATNNGLFWLALVGAVGSVIGAFYYLKIVKTMYFDEPAAPLASSDDKLEGGLIAISAVIISPLGYLAIPALSAVTLAAAKALF